MIEKDKILEENLCEMKVEEHSLNRNMKVFFHMLLFSRNNKQFRVKIKQNIYLNPFSYVLILTGSSSLSEKFGHPSLVALYQL